MSHGSCPSCFAPFAFGRKIRVRHVVIRLDFCSLCGEYVRRCVDHDALITPFSEVVKVYRFRRVQNARTDIS